MKGRGASSNPKNRFERLEVTLDPGEQTRPQTEYLVDDSQSIITRNSSPDISFTASLNPYRGCEHGCSYCYARPYHEYLGFSAGLDFESKILAKPRAAELLRKELSSPKWKPECLAMSGVTDCYQPVERKLGITRDCLRVLADFCNPVAVVTKNHLVTRDIDLLSILATQEATGVYLSITTLDASLAAKLEPRASSPRHRLDAIRQLSEAGIPTGVLVAPVIPGLNEHEIPAILKASREAGATQAGMTLLRLPFGVKDIFLGWLETHYPEAFARVEGRIREIRGGNLNDFRFGSRMKGEGVLAEQIEQLFQVASNREGFGGKSFPLSTKAFRNPQGQQLELL